MSRMYLVKCGLDEIEWDQLQLASKLMKITDYEEFVHAAVVAYSMSVVNSKAYNGESEAEYFAKLDEDLK